MLIERLVNFVQTVLFILSERLSTPDRDDRGKEKKHGN
jgi:hypothetical protein